MLKWWRALVTIVPPMRAIVFALILTGLCLLHSIQGHKHHKKSKKPCCKEEKPDTPTGKTLAPKETSKKEDKPPTHDPPVAEGKEKGGGCCHAKKGETANADSSSSSSPSFWHCLAGGNWIIALGSILGVLVIVLVLQNCIVGKR